MNKQPIRLILSDIRSTGNVGAILRTADACGIELVYACGYTPYPQIINDDRPPHVIAANSRSIAKTALGAETTMPILHYQNIVSAIAEVRQEGFKIILIEQADNSLNLYRYEPITPIALIVCNEVTGASSREQALSDHILELPMIGHKESLNVASAGAIAMYQLRFGSRVD